MNTIQILEGGKLSPSYDNVLDFKDIAAQNKYWESKTLFGSDVNTPIELFEEYPAPIVLPYDMVTAKNFNYMRINVQVGKYSSGAPKYKWYYYFITKVEYNTPLTVIVGLQLDVWQTYLFDYEFYESFIEREHQDRYASNGKAIFNRMPEDLDLGEKTVVSNVNVIEKDKFLWFHIITKTAIGIQKTLPTGQVINATDDYRASLNGLSQGFFHYLIPFNPEQPNREYKVIQNNDVYVLQNPNDIIQGLSTSELTISIRLLPYAPIKYSYDEISSTFTMYDEVVIHQPSNTSYIISDNIGTPSGGGTTPSKRYGITYTPAANGSIIGPAAASEGDYVSFAIKPNAGYILQSLTIRDDQGGKVPYEGNTFIMPGSNVTLTPKFDVETSAYTFTVSYDESKVQVSPATGTAPENELININVDDKQGYTSQIGRHNVQYYSTQNGFQFRMPATDAFFELVSEAVTDIPLELTVNDESQFTLLDVPSSVTLGATFIIKIRAAEGYYIRSVPCKAVLLDGFVATLKPDVKDKDTVETGAGSKPVYYKIAYTVPVQATKVRLSISGQPLDKAPEPTPIEREAFFTSLPTDGGSISGPKLFYKGDKLTYKILANYQEDPYTGDSYQVRDNGVRVELRDSAGTPVPFKAQNYYTTVDNIKVLYKKEIIIESAPDDNFKITANFDKY